MNTATKKTKTAAEAAPKKKAATKTTATKAKAKAPAGPATASEYLAGVDEAKRADVTRLHRFIRKALPDHAPCIVHGMIGYGPYHYRYDTGREGDSARVALAALKTGYAVYVMCVDGKGEYLAERARATLGKASVGKSCIRFKRVEDLDLDALRTLLESSRTATALGQRRA